MQTAANLIFSGQTVSATDLLTQILELLVIAIPIAAISWTVTHEEVFRELR